ncbi:hypothetical protein AB0230_08345 [Microbacterium sp. NPDC089190]|uniref:hypothetical protein n=1 Tax=Microbacterium sp. NPDC089190 TaxID=3155063 RepID=UPI00344C67D6
MDADPPAFRGAPLPLFAAAATPSPGSHPSRDPHMHRIRPGVYTERAGWGELPPWNRYLLRVHAFRIVNPEAVFSHESAAALHGLPTFGHPRHIHLFDGRRERSLAYGDVRVHTSADRRRTVEQDGLRCSLLADVVVDLARVLPPAFALAVADAALRTGTVTSSELLDLAAAQRNPRGRRRVDWVLARGDQRSESVGESLSRAVIEWCGFPAADLQTEHRVGGRAYRSDFCWPEHRVIGEFDGWMKYDRHDPDAAATAVRAEKTREDALRRAGWRIARWDYGGALRVDGLREALKAAGLPVVARVDGRNVRGVGLNPRSE